MTTLTRRYHFSASHRLHVDALSDQENSKLFGKCNNPFGHGHDYILSVTVRGPIDRETGLIVPLKAFDSLVGAKVLSLFAYRNINLDIAQFADLVPTTENAALVIASILEEHWAAWFQDETAARLDKVHLQETDRNGFEIRMHELPTKLSIVRKHESVAVNA
ncbi:MAG: 6-carboxytetrahydropterin synthase [Acidobacteriota bacterium]|nr:6-carboxytetrahydropterin synthase [Acidobacteriota bacterium]